MLWFADIAAAVDRDRPHVINDSKTPSGRVHVGALRGVVMHDAVFRALKERGTPVRYIFGVDDYDPVDEIPAGQGEFFEPYRGAPLCNVPAPQGSSAPDMATHFISEFFDVFKELGVEAETYRMRDIYRAGSFDAPIDAILSRAADVRRIYKEVSGSVRSEKWYPFQVVCENCGRIGTTEVFAYDGKEVEYACRPNLVKWAKGCGHHGKMSPFGGKGKLPWKLEWVAKWQTLGVTIEGAGKDHTTKGGARDVAGACFKEIFGKEPPVNIPYEFFLVSGKKMSSSKGIGASAREMADFLPPEILRYLILRTQPKNTLNFEVTEDFMVKLFNDFDRQHKKSVDPAARDDERELYRLCEIGAPEGDFFDASFQLILTFVQMPHVDLLAEIEKRKGAPLTEPEKKHFLRRRAAAQYFLERYASEEDRIQLQETLPARAAALSAAQRGFAHLLAEALRDHAWDDDALQARVFDAARRTPIEQPSAFKAIYRLFFDKEQGPRAGAIMAVLDRDFVIKRLTELPLDRAALLAETASKPDDIGAWLTKEGAKIASVDARVDGDAPAVLELLAHGADEKAFARRSLFPSRAEAEAALAALRQAHRSIR
jgi:lysyl-tRNA synthetase, class I